ncbi:tyrosine-type recombinase/integrase [Deinococcus rufus]|uniref:Tyrosine-type recombinase/integrase n=1 Tax=Deinococcus rufus TaxID=2136097 RepID=A0ABV7Z618_9DEIO
MLSGFLIRDLRELGGQGTHLVIGRTPEAARNRLRTLCIRVGVPYRGLHALRHTAGTRLVRAGFQLQDVAKHLGHSDVQTARPTASGPIPACASTYSSSRTAGVNVRWTAHPVHCTFTRPVRGICCAFTRPLRGKARHFTRPVCGVNATTSPVQVVGTGG